MLMQTYLWLVRPMYPKERSLRMSAHDSRSAASGDLREHIQNLDENGVTIVRSVVTEDELLFL